MMISSAEFEKSVFDRAGWPAGRRPEIAFLGRSNVGKSSLLNSLLGRRSLARTSRTPGRTQAINFFLVNDNFYFVDLPGYGYAKVSKSMRQDWGKMAEEYLTESPNLKLSIQIVDARHGPSALDRELNEWLLFNDKPHLIVATKSDKLSANELAKSKKVLTDAFSDSETVFYSSQTGRGRDKVWSVITSAAANS